MKAYQNRLVRDFETLQLIYNRKNASPLLETQMQNLKYKIKGVSETLNDIENEMNALNFCSYLRRNGKKKSPESCSSLRICVAEYLIFCYSGKGSVKAEPVCCQKR